MSDQVDSGAPPLERKKSVRFKDDVEFHSYVQRGPSVDNLLDLLDNQGNIKTNANKVNPPAQASTYKFTPANFARPTQVPNTIQLGADVALVSLAFRGSFITGNVLVRNISFEKEVAVRYTTNEWATVNDVNATYFRNINGIDCFRFLIKVDITHPGQYCMKFCVRYRTGGREFWDNNGGRDYVLQVEVP
eukprot:comp19228_c0_seq1/m.21994 comp19228_c0_seq1/g.21994  ORF comp19228_c0_seq1/g.21994 comp19228_c0_seq1/m.21994 type:complete len:190 (-) comp19228_c0_seq1:246-815(-)